MIIKRLKILEDTRNHAGKMKNQDWHSLSTAEAKPQGENRNTARMANRIISNVEVKTIGQTIVLNSARSSKVNFTPNLKIKNQKKKMMVTRLRFTQVTLYQVNDNPDEEDSDDERDERKTLNPDYIYLDSCLN